MRHVLAVIYLLTSEPQDQSNVQLKTHLTNAQAFVACQRWEIQNLKGRIELCQL